jgi:methyl-accepting chemotaxis protein
MSIEELRNLTESNARAIQANSNAIGELSRKIESNAEGVDAAIRSIGSMQEVAERLEETQNQMRQEHTEQMERLGQILELLVMRT